MKSRSDVSQRQSCAPESPPIMRCGTAVRSPGDLVAVLGIGGLGHLGIQFANKFGYKVAAIGRGPESAALAKKLGASVHIDNKATNAAEALQKLGGGRIGDSSDSSKLEIDVRGD